MNDLYPVKVQKAVAALLTGPAICAPALRQAIAVYAMRLAGSMRDPQDIPGELVAYVDKVTLFAYKITDDDVQRLKDAGYSEDAIFEITLCASLGASLARLERGLLALKGT